jgi:pyridoxine 5-phosphate synthase
MRLCINIDHVATLRQARGGMEPDPVSAAHVCELAGADGIVCHLREDRRHINDRDLRLLRETVKTKLDLEMAATPEIVRIAVATKPELATLVPERREELTTEGGLDVVGQRKPLSEVIRELQGSGIDVSLFIDPVPEQIEAARDVGSTTIEIHTGAYANARTARARQTCLDEIQGAARMAARFGLTVHAGHGLHTLNILPLKAMPEIVEVSIGHAVIARAVIVGLDRAVREMVELVR